jgi:hypothetical protein
MSPRPLLLIGLVGIAALSGCGSSGSAEEGEVKQAVRAFARAFERVDGKQACSLMTGEARRQLGDRLARDAGFRDTETYLFGYPCEDVISLAVEQGLDPNTLRRVTSTEVDSVEVDGDSAVANVGNAGESRLKRIRNRWRISHIGGLE